jgi:hypothetical protein
MPPRSFSLLIGIDEAGYGPNLGPLVIGCSAWLIESDDRHAKQASLELETLLDRMKPAFQGKPIRSDGKHIPLGDSKVLHSKEAQMDSLWLGINFWMQRIGMHPKSDHELIQLIAPEFLCRKNKEQPWYQFSKSNKTSTRSCPLEPFDFSEETRSLAEQSLKNIKLRLVQLSAKIIDEASFNRGVVQFGNKAGLLSFESLSLALESLASLGVSAGSGLSFSLSSSLGLGEEGEGIKSGEIRSIHVYCDKHGGRNRYLAPLMQVMPEHLFQVERESSLRSDYHSKWTDDIPIQWSFVAKGDRLLGSALALTPFGNPIFQTFGQRRAIRSMHFDFERRSKPKPMN